MLESKGIFRLRNCINPYVHHTTSTNLDCVRLLNNLAKNCDDANTHNLLQQQR
jgi:hypothetical protein